MKKQKNTLIRTQQRTIFNCGLKSKISSICLASLALLLCASALGLPLYNFSKPNHATTHAVSVQNSQVLADFGSASLWDSASNFNAQNLTNSADVTSPLLRSPQLITATSDAIIVYDAYTQKLLSFSHNGSFEDITFVTQSDFSNVMQLASSPSGVFLLQQKDNATVLLSLNTTTLATTQLTFEEDFNIASSTFAISQDGTNIYFYNQQNAIQRFLLSSTTLIHQQDYSLNVLDANEAIKKLLVRDGNFFILTTKNKIYQIEDTFPYASTVLASLNYSSINDFAFCNQTHELFYCTSNHLIYNATTGYLAVSIGNTINISSMFISGSTILSCDTPNHKINITNISSGNSSTIIKNNLPTLTLNNSASVTRATINEDTQYFSSIDAVIPVGTIPAESNVIILSEANFSSTHDYVLYTASGKNHYGYIKKDASKTIHKTTQSTLPHKIIGEGIQLYNYPSVITDDTNYVVATLQPMQEAKKIIAEDYTSADGKTFALIQLASGTIGYVEAKTLALAPSAQAEKIKCDARTIRATTIYASSNGTDEITVIPKNVRIKIYDTYNKRDEFVKIVYQLEDGTTITGYAKTRDIKTDDLSTLQILGIGLIAVNVIFTIVLLITFKKFRRQPRKAD